MDYLFFSLLFASGLAAGSFLGAYTYRLALGKSIAYGRSFCDHCKKKIAWYDNIPILSFIFLSGKCRACGRPISLRYPVIELTASLGFVGIGLVYNHCLTISDFAPMCEWRGLIGILSLPYLLFVYSVLIAIFTTDLEHQIIFDSHVTWLFLVSFLLLFLSSSPTLLSRLHVGFSVSSFLLLIHFITRGRGMGLGDVKLAVATGLILGWPGVLVWVFLSFITGAIVGLILIALGKARFGKHIAFGPFLVISLIITLVIGKSLFDFIFPFQ